MVKRSERLKVVLELAARKEKSARDLLSRAQQALQAEQARYGQLEAYMQDYQQKIRGEGAQLHVALYANYQNFMHQLNVAMEQQQKKLVFMKNQVDAYTKAWRVAHEKTRGMESHIDQCKHEELLLEGKQEQKMLDEFSQLSSRYRGNH